MFDLPYNLFQLVRVAAVFIYYRCFARGRKGERLAAALTALGPSFIKLGQTLSARADIVGEELAQDLAQLRDRLPPFSATKARRIIERDLRKPVAALFQEFNNIPVAAASISQVHEAVTMDGKHVAVKVLRPDIEKAFKRDLRLLYFLAKILSRHQRIKRLKLKEVVKTLRQSIVIEMDLRFEAAAASELRENLANDSGVYIPQVDWNRTSQRVFTMEWVNGTAISDRETLLAKGIDLKELARKLALTFFNQAYRDGFFHADLHPGNLFVDDKGDIVIVDFGIMGRLDHDTRIHMAEIIRGFIQRDYQYVAETHFRAGYVPGDQSVALFAQACRSIGEPIVGRPVHEMSVARLMAQLFKITEDFQMETQPQLLLLQKTMMLVEGTLGALDPQVNFWQLAEPWMQQWAKDNLGVKARMAYGAKEFFQHVQKLPRLMEEISEFVSHSSREGLRLHPETLEQLARAQQRGRRRMQILWLLLLAVGVAIAGELGYIIGFH